MRMILALSFVLAGNLAHAAGASTAKIATLDQSSLDAKLGLTGNVVNANIQVDESLNQTTLTIQTQSCPVGARCASPVQLTRVSVPIISNVFDGCKVNLITGYTDHRPVDGALQWIEVRDNSQNICPTKAPLRGTEVTYKTDAQGRTGTVSTVSYFAGDKLGIQP